LINGLTLGAIYGLIALGYTMVYASRHDQLRPCEVYMVGRFIAVTAFTCSASASLVPLALTIVLLVSVFSPPPTADDRAPSPIARCAPRRGWHRLILGDRHVDLSCRTTSALAGARVKRWRR